MFLEQQIYRTRDASTASERGGLRGSGVLVPVTPNLKNCIELSACRGASGTENKEPFRTRMNFIVKPKAGAVQVRHHVYAFGSEHVVLDSQPAD